MDPPKDEVGGGSVNADESNLSAVVKASHLPILSMDTVPTIDEAIAFFAHHFIVSDHDDGKGYLSHLPAIYQNISPTSALSEVVVAIGMAGLSNIGRGDPFMLMAREKYTRGLHVVNSTLRDPNKATADQTLMAVMLLALFEVCIYVETPTPPSN